MKERKKKETDCLNYTQLPDNVSKASELPLMRLYLLYQRPNSWHLEVETLA